MQIGHEGLRPHIEAQRGWDHEREEAGFRAHFEPRHILIVLVNDAAVGYTKLLHHSDYTFLEGIYLSAATRGQGLGTRLLEDMLAVFAVDGRCVKLRVLRSNPAQHLYRRLGFALESESDDSMTLVYEHATS